MFFLQGPAHLLILVHPQVRLDPCQHLTSPERLGQVIVGTGFEVLDYVLRAGANYHGIC